MTRTTALSWNRLRKIPEEYFHPRGIKSSSPCWLTILKVVSLFTVVIPLIMLVAKAISRWVSPIRSSPIAGERRQSLFMAQQELEAGIALSKETVAELSQRLEKIFSDEELEGIVWQGNVGVFNLDSAPGVIFKVVHGPSRQEDLIRKHFAAMVKAKEICLVNKLNRLVVPSAKLIEIESSGKKIPCIVEERLPFVETPRFFSPNRSIQEKLHFETPDLIEAIEHWAIFVAKFKCCRVDYDRFPILAKDPVQIGVIDIRDPSINDPQIGFWGEGECRGLIECLGTLEGIERALAVAQDNGIEIPRDSQEIVEHQKKKIATYQELQRFYQGKGITEHPRKLIQVEDLTSLGLDLKEKAEISTSDGKTREIVMEEAIRAVLGLLNTAIAESWEEFSTKDKRLIDLSGSCSGSIIYDCYAAGFPSFSQNEERVFTEEEENQRWIFRILDALKGKGHIFRRFNEAGCDYVQA